MKNMMTGMIAVGKNFLSEIWFTMNFYSIALLDYYLYLEFFNEDYQTIYKNMNQMTDENVMYISYEKYVEEFCNLISRTKLWSKKRNVNVTGLDGLTIRRRLNCIGYIKDNVGKDVERLYNYIPYNFSNVEELIKEQLISNIPVIIGVYQSNDRYLHLWEYLDEIHITREDMISYHTYKNFKHYMTITGVMEDVQTGKSYLIISSWGEKYILNTEYIKEYYQSTEQEKIKRNIFDEAYTGVYIEN